MLKNSYSLILWFGLFLMSLNISKAQDSTLQAIVNPYLLVDSIEVNASFITTDVLQNLYVIESEGEIIKFNPSGKEMFRFTEFQLGQPAHIDATNPFQVLVYFPEYMSIVTLDQTLSKTGEFSLFDLELLSVDALCFSNDGNIWLYDPIDFKLKKFNRTGDLILSSQDLSLPFEKGMDPNFMLERGNWLFVNDPQMGVLVFDVYGEYSKTIAIDSLTEFQVLNNQLIYAKDDHLFSYHLKSFQTRRIDLPNKASIGDCFIRVEKNRMYVADKEVVKLYSFK